MSRQTLSYNAASAIAANDWVEPDGTTGNVKTFDGTGDPLGIVKSAFDPGNPLTSGDEKVGVIRRGLVSAPAVDADYQVGQGVEVNASNLIVNQSAGTQVGTVVTQKTANAPDNLIEIDVFLG